MRETVLIVSDDSNILQTRAAVLRQAGVEVLPYPSERLLEDWPRTDVALAILCHTLEGHTEAMVLSGILERWPSARVLRVVSVFPPTRIAGTGTASTNPKLLVESVRSSLHASKAQAS
jgi:hypothetical protein